MIQSFREMIPVVHPSSYVHPMALVIGHVTIGPDCYIGSGAVLRGDWGRIVLESGCNVQENAVLHMFPGAISTPEDRRPHRSRSDDSRGYDWGTKHGWNECGDP